MGGVCEWVPRGRGVLGWGLDGQLRWVWVWVLLRCGCCCGRRNGVLVVILCVRRWNVHGATTKRMLKPLGCSQQHTPTHTHTHLAEVAASTPGEESLQLHQKLQVHVVCHARAVAGGVRERIRVCVGVFV